MSMSNDAPDDNPVVQEALSCASAAWEASNARFGVAPDSPIRPAFTLPVNAFGGVHSFSEVRLMQEISELRGARTRRLRRLLLIGLGLVAVLTCYALGLVSAQIALGCLTALLITALYLGGGK